MPSLFIDGQWVASGDGTTSPVVNPSDGTVVAEVDVATDVQVQAAIAAARRAFDGTDWPRTPTGERAALLDRVADLIDRDREEMSPRAETLNTGKAMRESRWDMADVAKVFRYYADLADKEAGRLVDASDPNVVQPDRLRAGRGVRADRAVELPAPADELEDRAGPRRRQHRGHEAGPADAAHARSTSPPARGGRRASGRRQPRPRAGDAGRPGARRQPRRRPRLADRWPGGWSRPAPRIGDQREAGRPRARWQEPQHRLRRRRLRDRRGQRPDGRLRPLRPGLLRGLPGDRPGRDLRPRSSRRSAAGPTGSASGTGPTSATEAGALISAEHRAKVEAVRGFGHRRRCPPRRGRPPTRRARAPGGLLLPSDGVRRCPARDARHPRGGRSDRS